MAGLAEVAGPAADTFWTWRDVMYRFALAMTPDQMEAIAAQAYVEMLESGFTLVGEFHYVHHDQAGNRYADIGEMASRIAAASVATGIGLTLLPVYYAHSDFGGRAPHEGQRRFINDLDSYGQLVNRCREIVTTVDFANTGVAPHSLRAVTPEELTEVIALGAGGPIHIHAAEQEREVEDSIAALGARPVQWLLANAPVDERWCLIHATHMTEAEAGSLAGVGATAGLCPNTEANLGDGIFPAVSFLAAGGQYGVGTDSNVRIGAAGELRQFEYSQRLGLRRRNVVSTEGVATGRALVEGAHAGGNAALGATVSGIVPGAAADLVSLECELWETEDSDNILNGWIFARGVVVSDVWSGGTKVVSGGRHNQREAIASRFREVMRDLLAGT
jgi:formiminoglutamate deiminase